MKNRRLLSNILKVLISVGALAWVLSTISFEDILDAVRDANLWLLLIAYVMFTLSLAVRAARWYVLIGGLGATVSFWRLVELYFVGSFFNSFLPSGFGGDAVRAAEVTQDVDAGAAVGTVIVDRLTGLMVLFMMALAVMPFSVRVLPANTVWPLTAISVLGLVGSFILLQGGFLRWLSGYLERWLPAKLAAILSPAGDGPVGKVNKAVTGCGWRAVGRALGISLVFNSMLVGWWYLTGRAIGVEISLMAYVTFIPLLSMSLLVPSIGGLGVRESVSRILFLSVGVSEAEGVALSLIVFALNRGTGIIGGLVYLISSLRALRKAEHD